MEEKIIEVLRSIGLTKNEVFVFLDLISHKTSSVLQISKRTKLHRANVYDALNKLINRGFVTEILQDEKRFFRALSFDKIKFYLKQKEQEVDAIIPLMNSIVSPEINNKEEVILSKGVFSLKNNLVNILENTTAIYIYGMPSDFIDILGEGFFKEFNKLRIRKKIPLKIIFKENPEDKIKELDNLPLTETRYSGLSYSSLTLISIFDDRVMMIVPVKPVSIIEIKSKDIAEAYQEYFKVLWDHSKSGL